MKGDIVIVGAGAVGLFIAQRLLEAGRSIIIIEAGDAVAKMLDNGGGAESIGIPHDGTRRGRAFGLGGTSAFWGGQLDEFLDVDLSRSGHEWPLPHGELKHWYDVTYRALGLPAKLQAHEYQRQLGIDATDHPIIEQYFTSWLPQPNFVALYKKNTQKNQSLKILLNAIVTDIVFEGNRAKSLRFMGPEGKTHKVYGNTFIFAAGTVANAQLFLTTQLKSPVPWKDSRHIGASFHDHFALRVAAVKVIDEKRFSNFFENGFAGGRKLQPKLRYTNSHRTQVPISMCAMFDFKSSIDAQIGNIKMLVKQFRSGLIHSNVRTLPSDTWAVGRSWFPIVKRFITNRRIAAVRDLGTDLVVQSEQIVNSASRIRVLGDTILDRPGLLPVGVDWQIDGGEFKHIEGFAADVGQFLEAQGLARLSKAGNMDVYKCSLDDTYHMAGGLVMSQSRSSGVTNQYGKVWDTDNIFIAGASLFPTSGYANTTFTALALGARLADHLMKKAPHS
jgi:choline dehydrogenase-like flavoprotein